MRLKNGTPMETAFLCKILNWDAVPVDCFELSFVDLGQTFKDSADYKIRAIAFSKTHPWGGVSQILRVGAWGSKSLYVEKDEED